MAAATPDTPTSTEDSAPTGSSPSETEGQDVEVTVSVANTGQRDGDDVVLLFTRDVLATLAPAVRKLAGFERVSLPAGAETSVTFRLTERQLALWDDDGEGWRVEPGDFEVRLGEDPAAEPLVLTVTP